MIDLGISGFKLDECDNSDYTGGWSFPECSQFPSGIDGEQMHSVFAIRYQQAIWEQFRKRDLPTYGLVRSSGALAAPYPFVLYSDLYKHRDFIRALVNSGFAGLLWCPEVRDARDEEDLIRRLQSVVFSPLAIVNGWYIKNPPWKQLDRKKNNAGELLENWERLEARCREIIGWRMQLVPYLTAAFTRYAEDGTPPFRALVLDAPNEPALQKVDDQYMVGDRMMVAPLFADEPERKVILPSGQWHDFWSGEVHQGGREIVVPRFLSGHSGLRKERQHYSVGRCGASCGLTREPPHYRTYLRKWIPYLLFFATRQASSVCTGARGKGKSREAAAMRSMRGSASPEPLKCQLLLTQGNAVSVALYI